MAKRIDENYGKGEVVMDDDQRRNALKIGKIAEVYGRPTRGVRREVKEFIARATAPVVLEAGEPITKHGENDLNYLYVGVNGRGLDVDIYEYDPTKPDGKGQYLGRAKNLPECNSLSCFNGVKGIKVSPNVLACSAIEQDAARIDPFCEINEVDVESIARLIEARMYVFEIILIEQDKLEVERVTEHGPLIIESPEDKVFDMVAKMRGSREVPLRTGFVFNPRSFVNYQSNGDSGEAWANSSRIIGVCGRTWVVTREIINSAASRQKIAMADGRSKTESNARMVMQGLAGELGGEPLTTAFKNRHVAELGKNGQLAEMLAFHKVGLVGGNPSAGLYTPNGLQCTVIEAPVESDDIQTRWILLVDYSKVSAKMATHNAEDEPLEAPTYTANSSGVLTRIARWLGAAN